jgi:nuclear pore complex protein Nup107
MSKIAGNEIKNARLCMAPVLRNWLINQSQRKYIVQERGLHDTAGLTRAITDDADVHEIREAYLPETILAYVSCLHFAGTTLSRDYLLESMDLTTVIAEPGSDVAKEFKKAGRMKELVESFASCSKAIAIANNEKSRHPSNSKKHREMGWSRELWSVKP